ncbi:hypothetical protein [Maricaulis sp.]|uniref:hypothetical protein n=1 Tax=Maricaulis sp. TaxID=1486257 RepID=UPI003A94DBB7|tara:strand:- start:10235 stop:10450 length:216 start_codon:yes stop_codon:yes gene_type:complete
MKNGIFLVAVIAVAWGLAFACPASVRDRVAEATQLPEEFHLEADRQMAMFVSWARDDRARPVDDLNERDLY